MFEDIQRLVERCLIREEKAWQEFIGQFTGLLYRSARERLRRNGIAFTQEDLEDIVQSVFLEIWEKNRLGEVRDRKKIKAWLSIMAQTRALNHMRQKKERLLREDELFIIDNIKVNDNFQHKCELVTDLEEIIEGLEAREKIVLKLSVLYGKTHKDIARFMKIPINTVSTIIARKKKILKERLKNFERK